LDPARPGPAAGRGTPELIGTTADRLPAELDHFEESVNLFDPALWSGKINIDGWRDASGGMTTVVNPSTGETLEHGLFVPDRVQARHG